MSGPTLKMESLTKLMIKSNELGGTASNTTVIFIMSGILTKLNFIPVFFRGMEFASTVQVALGNAQFAIANAYNGELATD